VAHHQALHLARDLKLLLDTYEKDPRSFYLYTGRVRIARWCRVAAALPLILNRSVRGRRQRLCTLATSFRSTSPSGCKTHSRQVYSDRSNLQDRSVTGGLCCVQVPLVIQLTDDEKFLWKARVR